MHFRKLWVAAALAGVASVALAQPETSSHVASGVGAVMATKTTRATATVIGIDAATRTVSLKNRQGKVTDLHVGDDVHNFDQIRKGDVVSVEYTEALSVSMVRQSGIRSSIERETAERAQPGDKPGGTIGREVTVTADVVKVDAKSGTVTLKGPKGRQVDVHVNDPQQLKAIRRGDQVQAVYTEALAISVTPKTGH
jgi:Cu/Ag efflux protein CusF